MLRFLFRVAALLTLAFASNGAARNPGFGAVPRNVHIASPEGRREAARDAVTTLLKKHGIPLRPYRLLDAGTQCIRSPVDNRKKGCYVGRYFRDLEHSGKSFWNFDRHCDCARILTLKVQECRIRVERVSLTQPVEGADWMDVPVGECVVAMGVWAALAGIVLPLLWFIFFRVVRVGSHWKHAKARD